jgi:hypothetical protein
MRVFAAIAAVAGVYFVTAAAAGVLVVSALTCMLVLCSYLPSPVQVEQQQQAKGSKNRQALAMQGLMQQQQQVCSLAIYTCSNALFLCCRPLLFSPSFTAAHPHLQPELSPPQR